MERRIVREDVGESECEVGNGRKRRGGDKREGEEPSEREMREVVGERECEESNRRPGKCENGGEREGEDGPGTAEETGEREISLCERGTHSNTSDAPH